jgi:hypothetical protein
MPYNSDTARLAGQKSKRGQGALSKELRDKLSLITSDLIDEINIKELNPSEKIALLRILVSYTVPKLKTEGLEQELEQPLFHIEIIDKTEDVK